MADTEHVKGLSDLLQFLDQLTSKLQANVMRGGLRAGMSVVKPAAQRGIHNVSGELSRGLKIGTRRQGQSVTSNLRATGRHRSVAHLVEFGTRPHNISARFRGFLSFLNIFRKEVMHPGTRPKPFMRPALDFQAAAATIATGEYIKNRLATKEGLDTSHVSIEGDV